MMAAHCTSDCGQRYEGDVVGMRYTAMPLARYEDACVFWLDESPLAALAGLGNARKDA